MRAQQSAAIGQDHRDAVAGASLDRDDLGTHGEVDAVGDEEIPDRRRDVLVLPRRKARPALDQRDLAAEPPERLRHFEAHVTAADHDETGGKDVQLQRLHVGEGPGLAQSGDGRDRGAGAEVQVDPLARETPDASCRLDLDHPGRHEATPTDHQL